MYMEQLSPIHCAHCHRDIASRMESRSWNVTPGMGCPSCCNVVPMDDVYYIQGWLAGRSSSHIPPPQLFPNRQEFTPTPPTMRQKIQTENRIDANGNPAGGSVSAVGFLIIWQDGPLGRGEDRQEPNGAFVEDVIAAAMQRIAFYQEANDGKFACDENARALDRLQSALALLNLRTRLREEREVEGTHEA